MKKTRNISFSFIWILFFVSLGGPILFSSSNLVTASENLKGVVRVSAGVVVDYNHRLVGKIGLSCIKMALSDFYTAHAKYTTRLVLHARDSNSDVVGAASAGTYSILLTLLRMVIYSKIRLLLHRYY